MTVPTPAAIVQRGTLREMIEEPAEPFVTRFFRAQRAPDSVLEDIVR
jgi:ABC-type proline/glycine betaine transport system ATPase subunit